MLKQSILPAIISLITCQNIKNDLDSHLRPRILNIDKSTNSNFVLLSLSFYNNFDNIARYYLHKNIVLFLDGLIYKQYDHRYTIIKHKFIDKKIQEDDKFQKFFVKGEFFSLRRYTKSNSEFYGLTEDLDLSSQNNNHKIPFSIKTCNSTLTYVNSYIADILNKDHLNVDPIPQEFQLDAQFNSVMDDIENQHFFSYKKIYEHFLEFNNQLTIFCSVDLYTHEIIPLFKEYLYNEMVNGKNIFKRDSLLFLVKVENFYKFKNSICDIYTCCNLSKNYKEEINVIQLSLITSKKLYRYDITNTGVKQTFFCYVGLYRGYKNFPMSSNLTLIIFFDNFFNSLKHTKFKIVYHSFYELSLEDKFIKTNITSYISFLYNKTFQKKSPYIICLHKKKQFCNVKNKLNESPFHVHSVLILFDNINYVIKYNLEHKCFDAVKRIIENDIEYQNLLHNVLNLTDPKFSDLYLNINELDDLFKSKFTSKDLQQKSILLVTNSRFYNDLLIKINNLIIGTYIKFFEVEKTMRHGTIMYHSEKATAIEKVRGRSKFFIKQNECVINNKKEFRKDNPIYEYVPQDSIYFMLNKISIESGMYDTFCILDHFKISCNSNYYLNKSFMAFMEIVREKYFILLIQIDYVERKNEKYVVCNCSSCNKINQEKVCEQKITLKIESRCYVFNKINNLYGENYNSVSLNTTNCKNCDKMPSLELNFDDTICKNNKRTYTIKATYYEKIEAELKNDINFDKYVDIFSAFKKNFELIFCKNI
ncbi:hypothetical protein COBT_002039 [Conglomerata obtusa]